MSTTHRFDLSRRDVLKQAAAIAAGAALPLRSLVAQPARTTLGAIDVHQHYSLPGGRAATREWSVERVLDLMGKNGIATVIFSNAGNGEMLYSGDESGRTLARRLNDYAAKMVS